MNVGIFLFVDDVDREDAEAVVANNGAGGTVLVERTLGHLKLCTDKGPYLLNVNKISPNIDNLNNYHIKCTIEEKK